MPNRFLEWLGRVVMLSLSGMITLSIIGAIAAIPSRSIGGRLVAPPPERAMTEPASGNAAVPSPLRQGGEAQSEASRGGGGTLAAGVPEAEDESERWLETIAYALLALVGLAALATFILWRSLHQRRRIADALEALARR